MNIGKVRIFAQQAIIYWQSLVFIKELITIPFDLHLENCSIRNTWPQTDRDSLNEWADIGCGVVSIK